MNNKSYRLEKLEKQLQEYEMKGKEKVEWELTMDQYYYTQLLGYNSEILLYRIKTRQFHNIREKPDLIKEIHYANKRGKWMMKKPLTDEEMDILKEYDIKFSPVKFRIYLRRD